MPFNQLPLVILASASPRRASLLRQLGVPFQVWVPAVEEVANEQLTPFESCQINAYRKARAAAKKFPDALVLGADTIVSVDDRSFGKPCNLTEATEMLEQLQ